MRRFHRLVVPVTAVAALGAVAVPVALAGTIGRATDGEKTVYKLSVGDDLLRSGGHRFAAFGLTSDPVADPDATTGVGGAVLAARLRLAPGGVLKVRQSLLCGSSTGGLLVYGTAGAGITKVKATLADGSRRVLKLRAAPPSWGYDGKVASLVISSAVGVTSLENFESTGPFFAEDVKPPKACR